MNEGRVRMKTMEECDTSWSPAALAELKALGFHEDGRPGGPRLGAVSSLAQERCGLVEHQPRVQGLGTACVFTDEIHEGRYLFLGY